MEQKNELISYLQNISLFLLGVLFMAFPIIFTTVTTNPIVLPKQVLLGAVVVTLTIFLGIKMLKDKSVKLRRTYFDIPVILLAVFSLMSAFLAVNQADALTAFVPYFLSILAYFIIVNIVKDRNSLLFLMSSLIIGAVLISVSAVLSFFKVYILPFPGTHSQTFTPLGSLLEQEIYLIAIFAISFYYLWRLLKSKTKAKQEADAQTLNSTENKLGMSSQELTKATTFGLASFIILLGIIVTTYALFKIEKPLILPLETGFQTALSEISLDSGRTAQGFLFGSGFGTYAVDFSRWKQASFNQNQDLWSLTFFKSSNLALELLATTGVLGLTAFLFLTIRIGKELKISPQNKMLFSLLTLLAGSFLLPLNFTTQTLFFIVLGLFAANQGLISKSHNRYFDIELQIVALKKGLIAMETPHNKNDKSLILPSIVTVLLLAMIGSIGYFGIPYIISDLTFQKSLVSAAQNNGSLTYQQQAQAISTFQARDGFYRVFSQTNLALANALASQLQGNTSPSAEDQQRITTLIQQAINSARAATTIAPQSAANWQNLSSIYRGLIGFGQNAEGFAIATAQQSINLDPNNPQQYISLGGIYYQLGQWENAQNQFQIAIALKPDYANSHYNLGHALEQKGDLQNALTQYQIVRSLVANDQASLEQIDREIAALQGKASATTTPTANSDQALSIDKPAEQLPPQNPPVKIPAPDEPTPTVTPTPTPTSEE
ncbi:MAG: tetratricopeptide repeat protein [Candidatus Levybacteria bacterium]|nr:tetratricopeptide repeat protein [Candidatus Levybacteria bacterium]